MVFPKIFMLVNYSKTIIFSSGNNKNNNSDNKNSEYDNSFNNYNSDSSRIG